MEARKRWKPNFPFSRGLRTIALTAVIFSAAQSASGSAKVGSGSNRANSITIKVSTELQMKIEQDDYSHQEFLQQPMG